MDVGAALARLEQQALRHMWKRVRTETADVEGLDLGACGEESLLRFLRAHSLDSDQAAAAFVDFLKWRINFGIDTLKLGDVVDELLREVLSLVEGRDRAGRPVLVLAARRNSPPAFQLLPFCTAATYLLERAVRSRGGDGTLGVVLDFSRAAAHHCDVRPVRLLAELLCRRYPGRVAYVLVAHKPAFFPEMWAAVAPSVQPWLLSKLHVLGEEESLSKLQDEMDDQYIPRTLGGTYFHNPTTQLYLWRAEEAKAAAKAAGATAGAADAVGTSAGVMRAGTMMKQGGTLKAWTSRHFVLLYTGSLQYFKDDKATDAKGAISLRDGRVHAAVDPGVKGRPFTLQLHTPARTHYLTCRDQVDLDAWITALNGVVSRVQGVSLAPAPPLSEAASPSSKKTVW